jgi:hypothetical protein
MSKPVRIFTRSFILAFLATGAMVQAANPLLVTAKLNAKGAKPIQSITVRIMPEEVFWGQDGAVYISHQSESSCVAWVDQAAVAGSKQAGQDVLLAAFEECGKTFE